MKKVISGAQTGADRAALDVAMTFGISHGGWVPRGRRAEDGPVPSRYRVQETEQADYAVRTEWNVRDSQGTLLVSLGPLSGGSALTRDFARKLGRHVLHVDLAELDLSQACQKTLQWLDEYRIETLNVAGPRESTAPGIYAAARSLLERVLAEWGQ